MRQVGQDGSVVSTFGSGQSPSVLNRSGLVSDLGEVSGMVGTAVASQAQTLSRNSYQRAGEASASVASSLTAAYDKARSFMQSSGNSTRVGSDAGINNIAQFAQAYENAMNTAAKWDAGIKLSDSQKFQILSALSIGGGIPKVLQAQIQAQGASTSQIEGALSSGRSYIESDGFRNQLNNAQGFSNTLTTSTGSESSRRAASEIRASLSDAERAEQAMRVSLSQAEAYDRVASEVRSGEGRAQADLSNFIVAQLGGAARANAALSSRDTAGQMALVDGYVKEWVQSQAGLIRQGDAASNAGLEPAAKLATPGGNPEDFHAASLDGIRDVNAGNISRVPGNPGAAPAIQVDRDGPGGQPGQTVTPTVVERAATAGRQAGESQIDDGRNEADAGRKAVAAPVQEETENPNIITRAGANAFAGGKPQDRNPAAEKRNTGGASGEW